MHGSSTAGYVLLIDELTRAKVTAVMGEILTFIEDRRRSFTTLYSRRHMRVATNLVVLATYNPTDRSAIEIDGALLRRLRVIRFDPDERQLREMLGDRLQPHVVDRLADMFTKLRDQHKDFDDLMPIGHGGFSEVRHEAPDLYQLWNQRLRMFLHRPPRQPARLRRRHPRRLPVAQRLVQAAAAALTIAAPEIKVPERGTAVVERDQWAVLREAPEFWRLADAKIVAVEQRGRNSVRLAGGAHVGRAHVGGMLLEVHEKVPGAAAALMAAASRVSGPRISRRPPANSAGSSRSSCRRSSAPSKTTREAAASGSTPRSPTSAPPSPAASTSPHHRAKGPRPAAPRWPYNGPRSAP